MFVLKVTSKISQGKGKTSWAEKKVKVFSEEGPGNCLWRSNIVLKMNETKSVHSFFLLCLWFDITAWENIKAWELCHKSCSVTVLPELPLGAPFPPCRGWEGEWGVQGGLRYVELGHLARLIVIFKHRQCKVGETGIYRFLSACPPFCYKFKSGLVNVQFQTNI